MAWLVQDKQRGARTIEDIKELAKVKKRGVEKFGCVRQPLFPSIPIDRIIRDVLHLFLRICDVLINLLILELWRLDGIDKNVLRNFDRKRWTMHGLLCFSECAVWHDYLPNVNVKNTRNDNSPRY